jgi:hypothetical protein
LRSRCCNREDEAGDRDRHAKAGEVPQLDEIERRERPAPDHGRKHRGRDEIGYRHHRKLAEPAAAEQRSQQAQRESQARAGDRRRHESEALQPRFEKLLADLEKAQPQREADRGDDTLVRKVRRQRRDNKDERRSEHRDQVGQQHRLPDVDGAALRLEAQRGYAHPGEEHGGDDAGGAQPDDVDAVLFRREQSGEADRAE